MFLLFGARLIINMCDHCASFNLFSLDLLIPKYLLHEPLKCAGAFSRHPSYHCPSHSIDSPGPISSYSELLTMVHMLMDPKFWSAFCLALWALDSLLYIFTYKTNKQPQISTVPNWKYYFPHYSKLQLLLCFLS